MTNSLEISMRIDFFRDIEQTLSVQEAQSGKDYAGSMNIDGARPLVVPRVGEYALGINGHLPYPFALVTAVEHRIGGIGGTTESPGVIVVITAPWPGDNVKDRVVQEFESQGWTWWEAQGDKIRAEADPEYYRPS
jgi:hypothetical protein